MEDAIFHCFKCGHEWSNTDYDEDAEGKEGAYGQGLECPECHSDDVGEPPKE